MKRTIIFISFVILFFVLFGTGMRSVNCAETKLTAPIGSEYLPGGFQGADDVAKKTNKDESALRQSFIFRSLIPFVIRYTIGLAAALSVLALILGGYQYLTAYGDTEKHDKAKKTIMYAVIGLIISMTAYAVVRIITTIQYSAVQ